MATTVSNPEKIRIDKAPVISTCARRFSVAKKRVNPTVRKAPPKSTSQMIVGTMPSAMTKRSRRASLMRSICRRISARISPSSLPKEWNFRIDSPCQTKNGCRRASLLSHFAFGLVEFFPDHDHGKGQQHGIKNAYRCKLETGNFIVAAQLLEIEVAPHQDRPSHR